MTVIQSIQNRIYEVRNKRIMLDFDLAQLYEVPTKALNQSVKRNQKRFPEDFMFRLSLEEWVDIRSQAVTASEDPLKPKVITTQNKRNTNITPFAFTEQGVAMLSSVLHSDKAINMNIAIMRAFVEVRQLVLQQNDIKEQLKEIQQHIWEHDGQLSQIYDAIENLLDEKSAVLKWNDRQRIGFNK